MSIFFTADLHLGHVRTLDDDHCARPFSTVDEMHAVLIDRWNSVVQPDDFVFVLGDVALGTLRESLPVMSQFTGRKILVAGNHDRVWGGNSKVRPKDAPELYQREFEYYCDSWEFESGMLASHFPYSGDSHGEDRYSAARLVDRGAPLVHGHVHNAFRCSRTMLGTPQLNVGVDVQNFTPVSEASMLQQLLEAQALPLGVQC
jgi:calcineurin-like phosphoesterase family protein